MVGCKMEELARRKIIVVVGAVGYDIKVAVGKCLDVDRRDYMRMV